MVCTFSNTRSIALANLPLSWSAEKILAHIIGDNVSATMPETNTDAASVNANSVNSAPVRPPWKPMGTYTAISTTTIAMMGLASSRAAMSDACSGVLPSSFMWRSTFSTTMMASSTTSPIASTSASSVSRLIE